MYRSAFCLIALFASSAVAQQTDLRVAPSDTPQRFTIETRSEVTSERRMRVDGELMEGRGPSGPSSRTTASVIEFTEVPDGADRVSRTYARMSASSTGPGGEPIEVTGDGVGSTMTIEGTEEKVVTLSGEALPPNAARRIPGAMNLSGLTPSEPIELGAEFPMGPGLRTVFGLIDHPITAAPQPRAATRPPAAAPEDGAERTERPGRGQGDARRRSGRAEMATRNPAVALLARLTLDPEAVGKVVEVDDQGIARILFQGSIQGEGAPEELGLGGDFRGGRRQQAAEAAPAPEGEGSVEVSFEGFLLVDTRAHRVQQLVIEGNLTSKMNRTMDRRGQSFEIDSNSEGTFRIALAAQPAPKSEPTTGATEQKPD